MTRTASFETKKDNQSKLESQLDQTLVSTLLKPSQVGNTTHGKNSNQGEKLGELVNSLNFGSGEDLHQSFGARTRANSSGEGIKFDEQVNNTRAQAVIRVDGKEVSR